MNANSNTIENKPAICEGCATEYNEPYYDVYCENCKFVGCKKCGEIAHRDDLCPHGIDGGGGSHCECICEECWHECGICYERKRWACDGGDFIQGNNCDHRVCVDCSVKIIHCPFCRKSWEFFEDSDGEEVDENGVTILRSSDDEDEEDEEEEWEDNREDATIQREHLVEFPTHRYCGGCDNCIECGCCVCGDDEEEEEECRNCHNENHEWCTGLVTSNEHNGMCHECYSRN